MWMSQSRLVWSSSSSTEDDPRIMKHVGAFFAKVCATILLCHELETPPSGLCPVEIQQSSAAPKKRKKNLRQSKQL